MAILSFICLTIGFVFNNISDLRQQYALATNSHKEAKKLVQLLLEKEELTPIEFGYLGSTKMVMAKFLLMPWDKLSSFNEGKEILEKAIKAEPNNAELIYLRYTIQTNAPAFLNYSGQIASDKYFLTKQLDKIENSQLKNLIANYLKKY